MSATLSAGPAAVRRRRVRSSRWRSFATSALLAWIGVGAAVADPAKWEADWSFIMRSGAWDKVGPMLTDATAADLATSPKDLFAAARSAATYMPRGLVRGNEGHLFIPRWFAAVGATLLTREDPDAQVARALAAVSGCVCRCAGAIGSGAALADAEAVAAHTLEFYERSSTSDGGVALADALGWMRAVLLVDGVDPAPVLAAQQALFAQLTTKATGLSLAMAKAQIELGKSAGTSETAGAKSAIDRCLAALKPVLAATPPQPDASALWNEALELSLQRKLGVKADYVMEEKKSANRTVRIAVPIGIGWSTVGGGNESKLTVEREGPGARVLYKLEIYLDDVLGRYKSQASENIAMGSDIKGLAQIQIENDVATTPHVTKKREPKLVSVGRGFAAGYYTEVTGTNDANRPMVRRSWIVRGKLHPYTYLVLVIDFTGMESVPPELQAVVDSLAEIKPSK